MFNDVVTREMLYEYEKHGQICLKNFYLNSEMIEVQSELEQLICHPVNGVGLAYEDRVDESDRPVVRSIMGWHRCEGILGCLAKDKRVLSLVKAIIGENIEFHQTKYNPKAPFGHGDKWDPHRGDTYWCLQDGVPYPEKILTVLIAITDQTEENGALISWLGTHKITLDEIKPRLNGCKGNEFLSERASSSLPIQFEDGLLEEYERTYQKVQLTGKAGTVWLMHSSTVHASMPNKSDKVRGLVANVFRATDNRPLCEGCSYLSEPANGPI